MAKRQNQSQTVAARVSSTEGLPPQTEPSDETPPKSNSLVKRRVAMFLCGIVLILIWIVVSAHVENSDYAVNPGRGASFFTLIPISFGIPIFLIVFPILYSVSRSFGAGQGPRTGLIWWMIPMAPVAAYFLILVYSLVTSANEMDPYFEAVFYFPLLGWRIYASVIDWVTGRLDLRLNWS